MNVYDEDFECIKNIKRLSLFIINFNKFPYPPYWYVYLNAYGVYPPKDKLDFKLPEVEKIWQIMRNQDKENIKFAISQAWTEEDWDMYEKLFVYDIFFLH